MGLGSRIRDPGSGKNLFRILDPGVKKAPDSGSTKLLTILYGGYFEEPYVLFIFNINLH